MRTQQVLQLIKGIVFKRILLFAFDCKFFHKPDSLCPYIAYLFKVKRTNTKIEPLGVCIYVNQPIFRPISDKNGVFRPKILEQSVHTIITECFGFILIFWDLFCLFFYFSSIFICFLLKNSKIQKIGEMMPNAKNKNMGVTSEH